MTESAGGRGGVAALGSGKANREADLEQSRAGLIFRVTHTHKTASAAPSERLNRNRFYLHRPLFSSTLFRRRRRRQCESVDSSRRWTLGIQTNSSHQNSAALARKSAPPERSPLDLCGETHAHNCIHVAAALALARQPGDLLRALL